ncbi:uncharacterized protein FTOL_00363 [Fusarium torulosum]|uniref:Uncharacterized protein n=1 Tax=Fusarium torulosum TaxID=33205 RepID=A0AAE8SCC3_9HYPO|nr:uncharacterized protein FTOL_00363 [Fusarium torulosum]
MSNDNSNDVSVTGGKRPHITAYSEVAGLAVGDNVYLLKDDGSREGPYLVATASVAGRCTLCYQDGTPFRDNEEIDVDELDPV